MGYQDDKRLRETVLAELKRRRRLTSGDEDCPAEDDANEVVPTMPIVALEDLARSIPLEGVVSSVRHNAGLPNER